MRRGIRQWGGYHWGPGKGPEKNLIIVFLKRKSIGDVLRILTWLVGAAVAFGIFGCAMLVKSEIRRAFLVETCESVLWV